MFRYRFQYLLIALVLLLLASPLIQAFGVGEGTALARILVGVLFSAMLLTAVYAVGGRRPALYLGAALVIPASCLLALGIAYDRYGFFLAHHVLTIGFIVYAVAVLLKVLFTGERVTSNTIYASLCVYLLLGVGWATAYSMIDICLPGSFSMPSVEDSGAGFMSLERGNYMPIYFSFVTLTTLGYGDITPVLPFARMVAVVEAIAGQLYIAVLVARLVGLHIYHSMEDKSGAEDPTATWEEGEKAP